jgi:hypothetical protein
VTYYCPEIDFISPLRSRENGTTKLSIKRKKPENPLLKAIRQKEKAW